MSEKRGVLMVSLSVHCAHKNIKCAKYVYNILIKKKFHKSVESIRTCKTTYSKFSGLWKDGCTEDFRGALKPDGFKSLTIFS